MSKSRAKKKQRQRTRTASGAPGATAQERAAERAQARATAEPAASTGAPAGDKSAAGAKPAATRPAKGKPAATKAAQEQPATPARRPRHPSRLDVRAGVPRPDAIWAPFPLTEIGMAVGLALFALGFVANTGALFLAGVGVLVVVVPELCLREHFAGFRSHSILLGLLPVAAVHLGIVYAGVATWRGPLALAIDLAVAGGLAWWLHQRFVAAHGGARLSRDPPA